MSLQSSAKFRPVLTAEQISHICALARISNTQLDHSILAVLSSFEFKIRSGAVTPAYIQKPRESLSSSLGFETSETSHATKEQAAEALYNQWLTNPSALTVEGLKLVRDWRYTHDKMTEDENIAYEREVMGM